MKFKKITVRKEDDIRLPEPKAAPKPRLAADSEERRKERMRVCMIAAKMAGDLKSYSEKEISFMNNFHPELFYSEHYCSPGHFSTDVSDQGLVIFVNAEQYSISQIEKDQMESDGIHLIHIDGDLSVLCRNNFGSFDVLPKVVSGTCTLIGPGQCVESINKHFQMIQNTEIEFLE